MLSYWQKCLTIQHHNDETFTSIALEAMQYQYNHIQIYREFVDILGRDIQEISSITDIPFLPIQFFKSHAIYPINTALPQTIFESSGTTGMQTSKHFVHDTSLYKHSFMHTFQLYYGSPKDYVFICLLPSYLERQHASLVYMCDHLVQESGQDIPAFHLHNYEAVNDIIQSYQSDKKIFIIGVSFALLDWAERCPIDLNDCIVMETGGMKGRREEWTRDEVHALLCERFHLTDIHSEYGMTELLSQGYSAGKGIFTTPPYLHVLVRDEHDPFDIATNGTGLINVIDLANIYSCSFIATDDIAKVYVNGSFEVLGRKDNSILRGCSMMSL